MSRSVLTTAFVCGLLAVIAVGGCRRVTPVGGAQGARPEKARKQAEELAINGFKGAATAQAAVLARANPGGRGTFAKAADGLALAGKAAASNVSVAPPEGINPPTSTTPAPSTPAVKKQTGSNPRPGSPVVIKEHVTGRFPAPSEQEAEEDALNVAREVIQRRLAELDPPVRYRPSANEVKHEFIRLDSKTVRLPDPADRLMYENAGLGKNLVYVEYDVEVTAAQVRELRTRDRLSVTLRLCGGVAVVALAGFLFLRTDEWTKGYLTRWLAIGAVALAGAAAAALYFV